MAARKNYRYIEPADPEAEKACRLTKEAVSLRAESPEDFFGAASTQEVLANGYELRFAGGPGAAARIDAFIADERDCCPFFAFESWEEAGDHVLRILRVDDEAEVQESLPREVLEGARRSGLRPEEGSKGAS